MIRLIKKATPVLVVAAALVSTSVFADTVNVTSVTNFQSPNGSTTSAKVLSFTPPGNYIVFEVAGKTCTWVSSRKAIGPKGCNYSITVNNSTMQISSPGMVGNNGCTTSGSMLQSCK